MSYLRFTPEEYRILCRQYRQLDLGGCHLPAFKRLLNKALAETAPTLARRLVRLRRGTFLLLYQHFRDRPSPPRTATISPTRNCGR